MSVQFKRGDKVVVDWEALFNSERNYPADKRGKFLYEDDDLVIDEVVYEELSSQSCLVVRYFEPKDNTVQFAPTERMKNDWWLPAFCLKKLEK